MSKEYNGWSSYETWCVGLWIDNDETLYNDIRALAQESWDGAPELSAYAKFVGKEIFSHEEKALYNLSNALKEKFEEESPELEGMWADLLGAALEEVNWRELAEHYLENVKKTEEV